MATATAAESLNFHHLSIHDVVSTPTLYFYDSNNNVVGQTYTFF